MNELDAKHAVNAVQNDIDISDADEQPDEEDFLSGVCQYTGDPEECESCQ